MVESLADSFNFTLSPPIFDIARNKRAVQDPDLILGSPDVLMKIYNAKGSRKVATSFFGIFISRFKKVFFS